jgi:MFS transporter, SP family, general alpha glucoside:H+ symporter
MSDPADRHDERPGEYNSSRIHVDIGGTAAQKLAENDPKFRALASEAKAAADAEHKMTLRKAFRLYPKAVAWSIFFSTAIAMEGYDIVLTSSFLAYPVFAKKYGVLGKNGKYSIPAPWQAGLSNGARVGEILGSLVNGIINDKFGFKKTILGTLVLLCGLIFIPFFAQDIETLQVESHGLPRRNGWYSLGHLEVKLGKRL